MEKLIVELVLALFSLGWSLHKTRKQRRPW